MTGSKRGLEGPGAPWSSARAGGAWRELGGLAPIVAALALWVWLLTGVVAPLSVALARIDASAREAPTCRVPPGALASAAGAADARACR